MVDIERLKELYLGTHRNWSVRAGFVEGTWGKQSGSEDVLENVAQRSVDRNGDANLQWAAEMHTEFPALVEELVKLRAFYATGGVATGAYVDDGAAAAKARIKRKRGAVKRIADAVGVIEKAATEDPEAGRSLLESTLFATLTEIKSRRDTSEATKKLCRVVLKAKDFKWRW